MTLTIALRRSCVALAFLAIAVSLAAAAPPPVETFFQDSLMTGAALSPNGRLVALRHRTKNSRMQLAVLDLETMKATSVGAVVESDVNGFMWVNDHRLVFNLTDRRVAIGDYRISSSLYAVNADGSRFRDLPSRTMEVPVDSQSSDEIYVSKIGWVDDHAVELRRLQVLNTITGKLTDIDAPPRTIAWLFDQKHKLSIAVTRDQNVLSVHRRDQTTDTWTKLTEFDFLSDDAIDPVYVDENGQLLVLSRNGQNTTGLYAYDMANRKVVGKPLFSSDRYDLSPSFIVSREQLIGLRYNLDAEVTQWLDPDMESLQKTIDRVLPNTVNRISVAARSETKFVLITAYAETTPTVFYLFNTEQRKLIKIGGARPDIDPKAMARTDMIRYRARDGLEIPAYLTLPNVEIKKNLPMVVLVHGGPWTRDDWAWDPEVQFLASRGYVVLQPQFRGSTGFGLKHFSSGWKQWGLSMQHDVADGTKWAIAQGIADARRICIAGAAYGGYSALMGLANDPDLFRCGFEWMGISDINLMYDVKWSSLSGAYKKYGMPRLIGDQKADADQLRVTSPIENAGKIRAPLLLAYGGRDEYVPIIHGEKFRDAVKKAGNSNVEWVEYAQEGHGWRALETNVDFWSRVERFLDANIGKH